MRALQNKLSSIYDLFLAVKLLNSESSVHTDRLNFELLKNTPTFFSIGSLYTLLSFFLVLIFDSHALFYLPNLLILVFISMIRKSKVSNISNTRYYPGIDIKNEFFLIYILTIASAVVWGTLSLGVVYFNGYYSLQFIMSILIIAAVTQSAVGWLFYNLRLCTIYVGIILTPTAAYLVITEFNNPDIIIGMAYFLYFLFLNKQAKNLNKTMVQLFTLKNKIRIDRDILKTTLESIPGPVICLNEQLCYSYVNEKMCKLLNLPQREIVGRKFGTLNHSNHNAFLLKYINNYLSSNEQTKIFHERVQTQNGNSKWYAITMSKVKHSDGGYIIMGVDISNEKELETGLQQSAKLSAIGELSTSIVHEINNPLAIIDGNIRLLEKSLEQNKVSTEYLYSKVQTMLKSLNRISTIVNGLKKVSRASENTEKKWHFIADIVNEVKLLCELRAKKENISISVHVLNHLKIYCNEIELEQVLLNLVNNAIDAVKYLPNKWITISSFEQDNNIVFRIIDSGSGIKKEVEEKMFQTFFTTKPIGEGTGLGLSISKSLIEKSGAKIYVNHELKNTCFELFFPNKGEVQNVH